MSELLTICVLTYNRPDYLSQSLESILSQTFQDFRVIILDNASELDYSEVLSRFTDPRISYRRHNHNLGGAGNVTVALRDYSNTKYLMIFHDDDLMHPKLLEEEIAILEQNDDVVFSSTTMLFFEGQVPEFASLPTFANTKFCSKSELAKLFLKGFPLHFGSTAYRCAALQGHAPDFGRYAKIGDRPFLLDVLEKGKSCAVINEPLVLYRTHPDQDSKIGDLADVHLIELYRAYRDALDEQWGLQTAWLFYETTGFELLDSYKRISPQGRESLLRFLQRSREAGVLCFPFAIFYILKLAARFAVSIILRLKRLTISIYKFVFR